MADEKRIIDQTTDTALASSGDYVIVDSQTEGTRKFDLGAGLAAIDTALGTKVDKVTGKGLSTEDYTTAEKTKLSGIEAQANKTVLDTELATAGKAADAKATGDQISQLKEDLTAEETARESADDAINAELATKADTDGAIASAEQLLSDKYTIDQVPYTFRASGSSGADREYDEIVGGSIVWNQLGKAFVSGNWQAEPGVTATYSDGVATLTSTIATNGIVSIVSWLKDHVYFVAYDCMGSAGTVAAISNVSNIAIDHTITSANTWESVRSVLKESANKGTLYMFGRGSAYENLKFKNFTAFNLTQMFGSTIADYIYSLERTTAGAGVAWFKKLFPKDYYAYDAGTMKHVSDLQSHDMVGFNAWDEEWEVGAYATSTGGKVASANRIRCKNAIPVLPNTVYRITGGVSASAPNTMYFYDENQTYLGVSYQLTRYNDIFRTPEKAHYMRFNTGTGYGETYKNDICINLSWDGERDGEYEPYVKHSYPLDDSLTLRGIPKLDSNNQLYYDGDIYSADGTVTRRYGVVDLGTLNWTKNSGNTPEYDFFGSDQTLPVVSSTLNAICPKYITVDAISATTGINNAIRITGTSQVRIRDTAYADAVAFKTAMSGVYLVYELATPTTEEAESYQELQLCDPYGTEEYVTASLVPVGHYTKYPANLRSAIERVMEQIPEAPSANGTYTLKATRTASGVTYAWVAE